MRVLARDNPEVDDGWLCDKGRFAYQSIHVDERITQPLVREGTNLMPASWEKALERAGSRAQEGGRPGRPRWPAARPPTRRRSCSSGCSARGSARATSPRAPAASCRSTSSARSPTPRCRRRVPDLEFAHTVVLLECDPVDDAPILDLRIRKGVRRHNMRARGRQRAPDRARRRAPTSVGARSPPRRRARRCAGARRHRADEFADARSPRAGEDIVIVYGERLLAGPDGAVAARALLNLAARLGLAGRPGAGLLEIPSTTNGRGLREAGFAPGHGAGFATLAEPGRGAAEIAAGPRRRRPVACSTCCTPTRCARIRTAGCGRPRSAPRRP